MPAAAMPLDALPYDPGRPSFRPVHRISHPDQMLGEGLARQAGRGEMADEALAARFGLPLGPPMIAKGVSGFRGANLVKGAFGDYLRRLGAGRVPEGDILGLDKWSRLTRLPLDESSHLLTTVINKGVRLYIKKHDTLISREKVNGATGFMDLAMALMHLKLAHQESETKSRYNRITIAIRHEQAEKTGTIRSKQVPGWLDVSGPSYKEALKLGIKRDWIVLEGPEYVVKRVFREAPTTGIVAIAAGLNRDWLAGDERCAPFGVVKKRKNGSAGWYPASVAELLHDRRVIGEVRRTATDMRSGEKSFTDDTPYLHLPEIISPKEFDTVQDAIAARTRVHRDKLGRKAGKGGRKGYLMPNILTGMVRCECGSTVSLYNRRTGATYKNGTPRRTTSYNYLQCRDARIGKGCEAPSLAYEPVEGAVLDTLTDTPAETFQAERGGPIAEAEDEASRLAARLDFITRQVAKFAETEDEDEQEAMRPKLREWGREKREIGAKLAEVNARLDKLRGDEGSGERLVTVRRLRARMLAAQGPARVELRRELHANLARLVDGIWCGDDRSVLMVAGAGRLTMRLEQGGPREIMLHDGAGTSIAFDPRDGKPTAPFPTPPELQAVAARLGALHPDRAKAIFSGLAAALPRVPLFAPGLAAEAAREEERVRARRVKWAEKARRHRRRRREAETASALAVAAE